MRAFERPLLRYHAYLGGRTPSLSPEDEEVRAGLGGRETSHSFRSGRNATFRGLPGPRGLLRPPAIGLEFFLPGKHDIVEVAARTPAYYKRFRARICGTDVLIPPPCVGTSTSRGRASRRTRRGRPTRRRSGRAWTRHRTRTGSPRARRR